MTDLAAFPDVEQAVEHLLEDLGRTVTSLPADLAGAIAESTTVHRITCTGGADDTVTDRSRVDVETFAATKSDARDGAEAVRQRLLKGPHVVNGVVLDRARTDVKPHEVPWTGSPPPYRYAASYTISARR